MQKNDDVMSVLRRLVAVETPPEMETRILCSCRSNLFETSCARRRTAVRLVTICSLANVALGLIAFQAHQRHVHLKADLYGD
jgi:hypothetical protein